MKEFSWARIVVCGLVAGGVWTALSIGSLWAFGDGFFAEVQQRRGSHGGRSEFFLLIANIGAGIWATWLYAALRPRYGAGAKSAFAAALAWWLMATMQSAKWAALLGIRPSALIALVIAILISTIGATLVGAWFYER